MFKVFAVIFAVSSMCFSQQVNNSTQKTLVTGEAIISKAREMIGLSSSMISLRGKL